MALINVTVQENTITVSDTTNQINVSTTQEVISLTSSVSGGGTVSNANIRAAVSAVDSGGDGSFAYNQTTGVFTYTGPSAAEVRSHISNTAPILYDVSTGVISVDPDELFSNADANAWLTTKTTDDLAQGTTNLYLGATTTANVQLKRFQETVVEAGNVSGAVSFDLHTGTVFKGQMVGNISSITLTNASYGSGATIVLTQDGIGNHVLDTSTMSTWAWAEDYKTLNSTPSSSSMLSVVYDGAKFRAAVTRFDDYASNVDVAIENYTGSMPNLTGNVTTTANISGAYIFGNGSQLTNLVNASATTVVTTDNVTDNASRYLLMVDSTSGAQSVKTASSKISINPLTGNLNVGGNLEVTGNINYREVTDLLVRDQTITMNFGNATAQDAQIIVDRSGAGGGANTDVKWNEATNRWTFTNDGSTYYPLPESTTDLAEGTNLYLNGTGTTDNLTEGSTNLYYTQARFDTAFGNKTTGDLTEGSNLYWEVARGNAQTLAYTGAMPNLTGNITTTANVSGNFFIGNGSLLTNLPSGGISNADAKAYIESSGLSATAEIDTTSRLGGGQPSNVTLAYWADNLFNQSSFTGYNVDALFYAVSNDPRLASGSKIKISGGSGAETALSNSSVTANNEFYVRRYDFSTSAMYALYTDPALSNAVFTNVNTYSDPSQLNVRWSSIDIQNTNANTTLMPTGVNSQQPTNFSNDVSIGWAVRDYKNNLLTVNGTQIIATSNTTQVPLQIDCGLTNRSGAAGPEAGPKVVLNRNSGSPADGDLLGQLTFQGRENDTVGSLDYATITAKAVVATSAGTNEGGILANVIFNGTDTNIVEINSTGLTTAGNIEATGSHFFKGNGSLLTGITAGGGISNADAKAYIESTGLNATANIITTQNVSATTADAGANQFYGNTTWAAYGGSNADAVGLGPTATSAYDFSVIPDGSKIQFSSGSGNISVLDGTTLYTRKATAAGLTSGSYYELFTDAALTTASQLGTNSEGSASSSVVTIAGVWTGSDAKLNTVGGLTTISDISFAGSVTGTNSTGNITSANNVEATTKLHAKRVTIPIATDQFYGSGDASFGGVTAIGFGTGYDAPYIPDGTKMSFTSGSGNARTYLRNTFAYVKSAAGVSAGGYYTLYADEALSTAITVGGTDTGGTLNATLSSFTTTDEGGIWSYGNIEARGTIFSKDGVSSDGNIDTSAFFIGDGSLLTNLPTGGNSFGTALVAGQTNIQASQANATIEFVAGTDISLTTSGNAVTITSTASGGGGSYGNANVQLWLNDGSNAGNITTAGNLNINGSSANVDLAATAFFGNVANAPDDVDQVQFASAPGWANDTAITFKGTTNGNLTFLNGNTYYVQSRSADTFALYTTTGTGNPSQSGLGMGQAVSGLTAEYVGVAEVSATIAGPLTNTGTVSLASGGGNTDVGGHLVMQNGKNLYTSGISVIGGGTLTLSSVRVTDFKANDPLGIQEYANSAIGSVAPFKGSIAYVNGDRHGARGAPCYYDGSDWRYFSDDTTVTT